MKTYKSLLLTALLLGGATGSALANNPANPEKKPPECPGTPGAFISSQSQDLAGSGTPPGQVVSTVALAPNGQGAGDEVRKALVENCGIGALPQED